MDKKRRFSRLGSKLVGVSVLGLALAFAIFYLMDSIVVPWLLYSERFSAFWQKRNEAAVQSYQEYVTSRHFTVRQAMEDEEGQAEKLASGLYTIMVGPISLDTEFFLPDGVVTGAAEAAEANDDVGYGLTWAVPGGYAEAVPGSSVEFVMEMHQIQCADGVIYVSATPAALQYAGLGRIAGLLLALLGFCAVVVPYIVRLLRRIGVLSRETGVLMAGDLDHTIHVTGRDELSGLGEDIERLRRSVLARIEGEREAVGANSRLVTSLSHDLRTPLTKLTGYLDILSYHRYQTQAEHDEFLRLASEKAAQLKTLTDQMFASAQVDAPGDPLEPEVVDGAALLGQLLTEQCDDLRREGFHMQPPVFEKDFQLFLRTEDAVRVFDNLFSNLKKYADPAIPVRVQAEDQPDAMTIIFENKTRPTPDRTDSHGLGVPTVRELMKRSGGTLEVSLSEGDRYTSRLTFPKYQPKS